MPRQSFILSAPQKVAYPFLIDNPRCALFADMGLGKTSIALVVQDALRLAGLVRKPTLVLGPMRVCRDTWPNEVAKWDVTADTRISAIVGSKDNRLAALKRDAEVYTCNYEHLPWLVEHFLEKWPFGTVIADESTKLKNFRMKGQGGARATAIARVAHTLTKRWINLTGTPSPNGLKDLWGQMWYVDRGERLGRTYTAFKERWFRPSWTGHGIEPMPFSQQQIQEKIADICLTLDAKDYFPIKEPHTTPIRVTLPPAALKAYKRLEDTMYTELLSGTAIEVFNAGSLANKCMQFANGAAYTKIPAWEVVHNAKIEALESIGNEMTMPILVAYEFRSDLARLKAAFPTGVELATERGLAAFKGGHAPFGFAHPGSMGHGIDGLQYTTHVMARFGHGWDMESRMQMAGRIGPVRQFQAGFNRVVELYDIIADDTIDDIIIARHVTKRAVQDLLLDACKRR